ncbi:unnamed protein product [Protopolystoma xenopodis]|uniref:Uncharacterized protein n=1 Tax=Protopolystoma xenopodis TaxID=117903 RepID=A0A448WUZ3_9PLAT|nr:unnamed protein product [Protopolystoma xenopodis]
MRTPASPLLRAWSSLRASLPIQARRQRKSTASQKESSHNHVHQQQKSQHPNRHNSLSGVNGIRTSSTDITQQSHFLSSVSSAQADCSNSLNKPQKSCIREGLNGLSFSSFTHQRPSLPNNSQLPLSSSSRDCKVPISQPPGRPIIFSSSFIGFPAFDSWSLFDSSQQTMEARLSAPLASSLLSSTGSPSAPNATSECSAQFGSQTKSPISMNDSNNQSLILRPPPPMYRHSSQDPPLGVSDDIASSVSSFQRDPPTLIFPPPPILSPPSPPGVTNAYAQHATPPPRPTRPSHLVASQKSLHFISTLRTSSFQTSQPSDTSSNSTPDSHTNLQFVDSDNPEGTSESVVGDYIDHLTNEAIRLQQHSDEEDEDELNDNDSLLSTLSREAIAEQINTTLTRPPLISSRTDRPEPSELAIYPSDPKMSPDTFISSDKFSIQISGTACPDAPISLIQPRSTQDSFPKDFSFPEHCIPWSNSLTAPTSKPSQHLIDTCQPIVASELSFTSSFLNSFAIVIIELTSISNGSVG